MSIVEEIMNTTLQEGVANFRRGSAISTGGSDKNCNEAQRRSTFRKRSQERVRSIETSAIDVTEISINEIPGEEDETWPWPIPHCPSGLEALVEMDEIFVHQQIDLFQAFTNIETKNRYALKNKTGKQHYYACEESDLCMRVCCGGSRGFTIHIVDIHGREVIRMNRPFKCCAGICWFANTEHCSYNIDVEAPVGNPIGKIKQMQSFWIPHYDVIDVNGDVVFKIKGPCCICSGACCTCDYPFQIHPHDFTHPPIGCIAKQWGGCVKEIFTSATNFSVTFPKDLDVKMKAVLLGATFLIDMMFFQNQNQQ